MHRAVAELSFGLVLKIEQTPTNTSSHTNELREDQTEWLLDQIVDASSCLSYHLLDQHDVTHDPFADITCSARDLLVARPLVL